MSHVYPVEIINDQITDNGGPFGTPWANPANVSDDDDINTFMSVTHTHPAGGHVHEFEIANQNRPDLLYYKAEVTWEITVATGNFFALNFAFDYQRSFAIPGQIGGGGTVAKVTTTISLKSNVFSPGLVEDRHAGEAVKFRFQVQASSGPASSTFRVYKVKFFLKNRYSIGPT